MSSDWRVLPQKKTFFEGDFASIFKNIKYKKLPDMSYFDLTLNAYKCMIFKLRLVIKINVEVVDIVELLKNLLIHLSACICYGTVTIQILSKN